MVFIEYIAKAVQLPLLILKHFLRPKWKRHILQAVTPPSFSLWPLALISFLDVSSTWNQCVPFGACLPARSIVFPSSIRVVGILGLHFFLRLSVVHSIDGPHFVYLLIN